MPSWDNIPQNPSEESCLLGHLILAPKRQRKAVLWASWSSSLFHSERVSLRIKGGWHLSRPLTATPCTHTFLCLPTYEHTCIHTQTITVLLFNIKISWLLQSNRIVHSSLRKFYMGSRHWEIECFGFCFFVVIVIVVVLSGRLETVGGNREKHSNERYLVSMISA